MLSSELIETSHEFPAIDGIPKHGKVVAGSARVYTFSIFERILKNDKLGGGLS